MTQCSSTIAQSYFKTLTDEVSNSPVLRIEGNGTGLVQALPEEDLSVGAIQIAHFNPIGLRVRPVELLPQPVTRQAIRGDYARRYDIYAGLGTEKI